MNKPVNKHIPQVAHSTKSVVIFKEIGKLLKKRVIKEYDREKNNFIFTIFTRKKKDGCMCTILNLKQMNKQVTYQILKWNLSQMFSKSFRQFSGWPAYI